MHPPQRNRKPLIITLVAGGAVLVVVVVIAVIALAGSGGHGGKTRTAGETMQAYLEALARGDAEAALSYSDDQPGSREFLTDEILKKQIDHMPITGIKILGDDSSSAGSFGVSRVHVSAMFGTTVSDDTVTMKKSGGRWKLDHAAIKIDLSRSGRDAALKTVTLFGKGVGESAAYVFPGWLDVGSSNPHLKVSSQPMLLNGFGYASFSLLNVDIGLSDKGEQALRDSIKDAVAKCTQSHALAPEGCPQGVSRYDAAENTVDWGMPDLEPVKIQMFNRFDMTARFMGEVEWPLNAKSPGGGAVSGKVSTFISGVADMAKNPPGIELRG